MPALPGTGPGDPHALPRDAVVGLFVACVTDAVRRVLPAIRGRGTRQSQRLKDARRGRAYTVTNLLALLADLVCDPRISTAVICDVLSALSLEIRAVRGDAVDAPDLLTAMQREATAQGEADVRQVEALGLRSLGSLQAALDATDRHRRACDQLVLALRAEYDRHRSAAPALLA